MAQRAQWGICPNFYDRLFLDPLHPLVVIRAACPLVWRMRSTVLRRLTSIVLVGGCVAARLIAPDAQLLRSARSTPTPPHRL